MLSIVGTTGGLDENEWLNTCCAWARVMLERSYAISDHVLLRVTFSVTLPREEHSHVTIPTILFAQLLKLLTAPASEPQLTA